MADEQPIHAVLADVMGAVRAVKKTDTNTAQQFRFRGIDAVVNAVGPVLRDHNVVVVPLTAEARYRDVRTTNDKPSRECTVSVTYRFWGPAGDHLDVQVPGEAMDFGDKGTAKAMSVAFRIALLQALCLPTDTLDPDHEAYERAAAPATAGQLRQQIKQLATAAQCDPQVIREDFEARTRVDINDAGTDLLEPYLTHLRTHGVPQPAAGGGASE